MKIVLRSLKLEVKSNMLKLIALNYTNAEWLYNQCLNIKGNNNCRDIDISDTGLQS